MQQTISRFEEVAHDFRRLVLDIVDNRIALLDCVAYRVDLDFVVLVDNEVDTFPAVGNRAIGERFTKRGPLIERPFAKLVDHQIVVGLVEYVGHERDHRPVRKAVARASSSATVSGRRQP